MSRTLRSALPAWRPAFKARIALAQCLGMPEEFEEALEAILELLVEEGFVLRDGNDRVRWNPMASGGNIAPTLASQMGQWRTYAEVASLAADSLGCDASADLLSEIAFVLASPDVRILDVSSADKDLAFKWADSTLAGEHQACPVRVLHSQGA